MKFVLSKDQENAIKKFKRFIEGSKTSFNLSGKGGVGKSFITKILVEYVEKLGMEYVLCAPTHKAKTVLEKSTEREAVTLHSLLALSPNVEIFKLDYKNLLFKCNTDRDTMPINGVIFIDECSMVNDELYKLIMDKCKKYHNKLVTIGDVKQICPVNAHDISKAFDCQVKAELTTIHRQKEDSPLLYFFDELRECYKTSFQDIEGENGSLKVFNNVTNFINTAIPLYKDAIDNGNPEFIKICCYTNNRVAAYNKCIRTVLFKDSNEEYNVNELLTCYESMSSSGFKLYNSMDYIIREVKPKHINIPTLGVFPGYILTLKTINDKIGFPFPILSNKISENDFRSIAYAIESIRIKALEAKGRVNKGKLWKTYFNMMEAFASPIDLVFDGRVIKKKTFDYGYAISSHRAQGSSYDNVFIDMKDISICRNLEERRQLQYVASSRTRKDLFILQ